MKEENGKLALIVMAAGFGQRFGGSKQTYSFGPGGEWLMDYSVYDAVQLGFSKIVLIVQASAKELMEQRYAHLRARGVEVSLVIQRNDLSAYGVSRPIGREKPFGTGHALLTAAMAVDCPFVVINADDYYGRETIETTAKAVLRAGRFEGVLTAFSLSKTLSGFGPVSRAICIADERQSLLSLEEFTDIYQKSEGEIFAGENAIRVKLDGDALVSMNCWGFHPVILDLLEQEFRFFLNRCNIETDEFFLPAAIEQLIKKKLLCIQVMHSVQPWFGVTYPQDKLVVQQRILELVQHGTYPPSLW